MLCVGMTSSTLCVAWFDVVHRPVLRTSGRPRTKNHTSIDHSWTIENRRRKTTRSVEDGIPTQSVGTSDYVSFMSQAQQKNRRDSFPSHGGFLIHVGIIKRRSLVFGFFGFGLGLAAEAEQRASASETTLERCGLLGLRWRAFFGFALGTFFANFRRLLA